MLCYQFVVASKNSEKLQYFYGKKYFDIFETIKIKKYRNRPCKAFRMTRTTEECQFYKKCSVKKKR